MFFPFLSFILFYCSGGDGEDMMQSQVAVYVNVSEQEGRIKLREKILLQQQQQHANGNNTNGNNNQLNNQKNSGIKRYVVRCCCMLLTVMTNNIAEIIICS